MSLYYSKRYNPVQAGNMDGDLSICNDKACWRAKSRKYRIKRVEEMTKEALNTIFVGRIKKEAVEEDLKSCFEKYGSIKKVKLVRDISNLFKAIKDNLKVLVTGESKGYAFVEFKRGSEARWIYKNSNEIRILDQRVLIDYERARVMEGWKPRRLGGGYGGKKGSGQMRFGCKDKPFKLPFSKVRAVDREMKYKLGWSENSESWRNAELDRRDEEYKRAKDRKK